MMLKVDRKWNGRGLKRKAWTGGECRQLGVESEEISLY
jgi:hypothetical protein